MLGGGGLLLVPPHFCWRGGGVGAAKSLLPSFLVPKGNQPTACTLALWWLKFGPTEVQEGGWGQRGMDSVAAHPPRLTMTLPASPAQTRICMHHGP